MVKEWDRFMGTAVEELKALCPAVTYYHTTQLHHVLTEGMSVWTVKVRLFE